MRWLERSAAGDRIRFWKAVLHCPLWARVATLHDSDGFTPVTSVNELIVRGNFLAAATRLIQSALRNQGIASSTHRPMTQCQCVAACEYVSRYGTRVSGHITHFFISIAESLGRTRSGRTISCGTEKYGADIGHVPRSCRWRLSLSDSMQRSIDPTPGNQPARRGRSSAIPSISPATSPIISCTASSAGTMNSGSLAG